MSIHLREQLNLYQLQAIPAFWGNVAGAAGVQRPDLACRSNYISQATLPVTGFRQSLPEWCCLLGKL